MGARLIAKGVDAEGYALEYLPPVRRGLEGVYFTNTNVQKGGHNYAPGKPQGSVVGVPVAHPEYTDFKGGTDYVQTPVLETPEITMFVICKATVASGNAETSALICGSYNLGVLTGLSLYSVNPGFIAGACGFGADDASNVNTNATVAADLPNWGLYSVTAKEGSVSTKNHKTGAVTTTVSGVPRRPAGRTLRIGSGYSTTFKGPVEIAAWQCHSVAMTADELAKTAADLKAYALRKGIVL